MVKKPPVLTIDTLRERIAKARLPAASAPTIERARRLLLAWLGTAARTNPDPRPMARAMRDGLAARHIAEALRHEVLKSPPEIVRSAACRAGCAFCCILDGPDGGTITEDEARRVHAVLSPSANRPDGREWHPKACPALDPDALTCRIYSARPAICRSFFSTDAEACRINSEGGSASGAGMLGVHVEYIMLMALSRAALKGLANVHSYGLRDVAEAAVEGLSQVDALDRARHAPKILDATRRDATAAIAAVR